MRNWTFAATALLGVTALVGCVKNPVKDEQVATTDKELYCQVDESIGTHIAEQMTCSYADDQMSIDDPRQAARDIQQKALVGPSR